MMAAQLARRCLTWRVAGCLLLGRRGAALEALDRLLARWPDDAHALASRAHVRAELGRHDDALADLRVLVAAHPDRGAADWFNLAFLLESAAEYGEALGAFRRCLALDPGLDRAWYGLGLTLIHLGRHEEAVSALQRNTELQPMNPYGWYQLARLHHERRRSDEALRIIRHLAGFEPSVAARLERETGLQA
jgi:tetratricopeptide (TPR) repeat protein